ncbi:MAG: MaoC family dehydratase N-terminal domain-containing protein [Bowdeniella nasicola]|nr:MaoC family dehydratase N-terminal domain-containing protein [Bowdeniella nasicola]
MTSDSAPSGVNSEMQGRTFGPYTYEVSAAKIQEFATATGANSPVHHSREAARAAGYANVVAPPTFAVVPAQAAEAGYVAHPESGIDFTRVVHADESFTHTRPITAGDTLHTSVEVTRILTRGSLTLITTTATITDDDGGSVATVGSTLAVRGKENDE